MLNRSNVTREIQISQTINGKSTSVTREMDPNPGFTGTHSFYGESRYQIAPGADLELHILDNDTLGSNVYGNGEAECLTDTGEF
jgi:hypothetical protein